MPACLALFVSFIIALPVFSQLRLPAIIANGMVLQQKDSVDLWGWSGPGGKVKITTGWNNAQYETTVSNLAKWKVKIATPAAGGPYLIGIRSGRDSIALSDVLIGEVWVCSGQSNMEWSYLNGAKDIGPELAIAHKQNLRFFHIDRTGADYPQDDVRAAWAPCDSNELKRFSAVGYFFGKKLSEDLGVPVGLINASWGGTPAEAWTPEYVITSDPALKAAGDSLQTFAWWPSAAGRSYNAMIAPITAYGTAGVIWYQGESNVSTHRTYAKLFTGMIDSWREAYGRNLPFYFVQIAPYTYGNNLNGALLREQQFKALRHPNVGMVAIPDLIDSVTNIHPSLKKQVGNRLANQALAKTYQRSGFAYHHPYYAGMQMGNGSIELTIDFAGTGLVAKGSKLQGFAIAGEDGKWVEADASISSNGNQINVWSSKVPKPIAVRYAFGNTDDGNVFNKEGLPLIPFRTDSW